ncbi:dipeptidylpeptidase 8 [Heterostelium album PN500]|uniref:Dipeptidylpeptidase 8 n=1 Tax=Heterostelium pallidum (strain ATCC 26659 / Pp 5 / PN500) TaxID=670386 RepID=D3BMA5_HETP5|nr:dipeptidylpeptidase 8 [Heterostelium album PN500]EFA77706.1 dipeptidylpeptidase 8 [Heterostelium album PN500]|eukprot:XP_020429834.1 dipeptidylpeptidase 8 [Heterostelium album PN500]
MTAGNKIMIQHNNKGYTKDDIIKLLAMEEYSFSPSKYQFDNDNHLFFLTNTQSQSMLSIHYINIENNQKLSDIKPLFAYRESNKEMSIEEELMRERQRIIGNGITSYDFNENTKHFLAAMSNDLYIVDIGGSAGVHSPALEKLNCGSFDPKLSHDAKLVAFIEEGDIWVTHLASGQRHRLTHTRKISEFVSAGESKFVYSEEFSRYTGYWWSPTSAAPNQYQIFYFEEDERHVRDFYISQHGYTGTTTHYKYPLAGDENTKVRLCLLTLTFNESNELECKQNYLFDLKSKFEWLEYYVRGGWSKDGKSVWVQLMDRLQQRLDLVMIPLSQFSETPSDLPVLLSDRSNLWVNVVDHITFLDGNNLIWSNESSGFRHLYLVSWESNYTNVKTRQLTEGSWVVGEKLWIDQSRLLIYFEASADSPLENHLYVCSYAANSKPCDIRRLTNQGHHHTSIQLSPNFTRFVSNYSSVKDAPLSQVYQLEFRGDDHFPCPTLITTINVEKSIALKPRTPTLFSFVNSKGRKIYGCYYLPADYNPATLYPSVCCVYGGPHVQIVNNSYSLARQFLSEFGFISIYIDGTGSTNRGLEFEGHLRERMGTIEIQDQVEGIEYLARNQISLDLERVAIQGWSYGGYLALMGIAQRPDFFKVAISGAPVTLWETYNTGYTERYMNTPKNNPEGYKLGNVLSYLNNFPDQLDRLVLIHGIQDENVHFANTLLLVEELQTNGKPYILKMLCKERHGIRDINNRVSIEAFRINHLLKNL